VGHGPFDSGKNVLSQINVFLHGIYRMALIFGRLANTGEEMPTKS
jgi:hypothetical protein